jgi:hypothetical protein
MMFWFFAFWVATLTMCVVFFNHLDLKIFILLWKCWCHHSIFQVFFFLIEYFLPIFFLSISYVNMNSARSEVRPFFFSHFSLFVIFFNLSLNFFLIECFFYFFPFNFILQYFISFELFVIIYFSLLSIKLSLSQINFPTFNCCSILWASIFIIIVLN